MQYSQKADYDAKKYKCAPWQGQRGPLWARLFKPAFENALRAEKDNFSNLHQWLHGMDFGGWSVNAPPHIAGGGGAAVQNALSIQARVGRGDSFLHLIKGHIVNEDINDAIDAHVFDLMGANPAPPPSGPGGANANPAALPTDWGMQLWTFIDTNYGQPRQTGLLISNQGDEWANAKLTDVGIDRETLRRFYGHLMRLNRQRLVAHPPFEVWIKFMKQITFPRILADRALGKPPPSSYPPDYPTLVHQILMPPWPTLRRSGTPFMTEVWR